MNETILNDIFKNVSSEIYCINKKMEINKFWESNEIDIFCKNIKLFSQKVLAILNEYIKYGYEVKINITNKVHWYIEIFRDNKIQLVFNLYASFKKYQNIDIKQSFFSSIIADREEEKIFLKENLVKLYFPKNIDSFIIRYLDYLDHNYLTIDNEIYLNKIIQKLENQASKKIFLDKLHKYTSFKKDKSKNKIHKLIFFLKKKFKFIT